MSEPMSEPNPADASRQNSADASGANPFAPPSTQVTDRDLPEPGSPFKALLLGLLWSVGAANALGLLIGMGWAVFLIVSGTPSASVQVQIAADLQPGSPLFLLLMLMGCGFSILGGYVCTRIARHHEYRLGILMALLGEACGWLLSGGEIGMSAGLFALVSLASAASVLLGVYFARAANRLS
jgi:hypothetical protein